VIADRPNLLRFCDEIGARRVSNRQFPEPTTSATVAAMRTNLRAWLALSALATLACKASGGGSPADAPAAASAVTAAPSAAVAAPSTIASVGKPQVRATGDGRLPFDYDAVAVAAAPGDMVLAPPRQWIDNAIEHGINQQPFVFFRTELVEPGQRGSVVKTPSGRVEFIPNALLIPIRKGERARPGQVVLTSWQSGTGLQRAMVIKDGTPESPNVHYLDLKYKHPSGIGKESERLAPDTFHLLAKPGEPGTSLACRDGDQHHHYIVVHAGPTRMIGLGFAGRLRVLKRSACLALEVTPHIDDTPLFVPVMGTFQKARVRHYEEELGRVFVRYSTAGEDQEDVLGIVDVARTL
jgi:hypothetical protein